MPERIGGSIRVGFMFDGTGIRRWQAEAVHRMLAVPGVEPVLLVRRPQEEGARKELRTALYRWYRRRSGHPAMAWEDPQGLLDGMPVLACTSRWEDGREHFSEADLDAIAAYRSDVLLYLGTGELDGRITRLPTHGVWSFHHGDPPGMWETLRGEPLTTATLRRLGEQRGTGRILRQGWFATADPGLDEAVLMHGAAWPTQVLRALLDGDLQAAEGTPAEGQDRPPRDPGNPTFLRFLLKRSGTPHRHDARTNEEWNIGLLHQPVAALLEEQPSLNVRWLPAPAPSISRATPFGYLDEQGRLNVLYEKYDHRSGRGEIARLRPKQDNVIKRSRSMLATGGHLSHPCVVQKGGTVYVVPEDTGSGRVDLYRVNAANDALEHVRTLLEEPLCGPTLFRHEGRWWLFGTRAPLNDVALHAWWSDALEGPWTPHLLNPIKMDIRSARPGGTPFVHGGVLWRPAQDRSIPGGRIALNRVLELTPARFREETVRHVGPLASTVYPHGLRTLCAMGDVTLVDGMRSVHGPERTKTVRRRGSRRPKDRKEA